MRKIFVTILVVAASLASCSAPYYPEYVPIVALGANTSNLVCENTEDECSLHVISNVEYKATIISGSEWLSFADTEEFVRVGKGNETIVFNHRVNNHGKRVARLVLSAESRRDTIRIKQKGCFEDFLEFHPADVDTYLTLNNKTRMEIEEEGGDYALRLKTTCLDSDILFWTDRTDIVTNCRVENGVFKFHINVNDEMQPRIFNIELSYIDGWDDKRTLPFSVRQKFNPID